MVPMLRLKVLPLLVGLTAMQLSAQVLTKPRSGLLTAEGIQVSGVDQQQISPSYSLT